MLVFTVTGSGESVLVRPRSAVPAVVVNVAVTDVAAFMVTEQLPVPLHAPLQLTNVDVPFGVAVSVTTVPALKAAEHVAPQLIPAGLDVTVPPPVPAFATLKVYWIPVNATATPTGAAPTVAVPTTVLVVVSITETVLPKVLVT
jgi:hypothetical protein